MILSCIIANVQKTFILIDREQYNIGCIVRFLSIFCSLTKSKKKNNQKKQKQRNKNKRKQSKRKNKQKRTFDFRGGENRSVLIKTSQ